jgi:hypothetical protein
MTFNDYTVRFTTVDRRTDRVETVEKSFKTEAARTKWLDKNDSKVVEVLSYSDPQ